MNYKQVYYPETKLGGFSNVDGTIAFYNRVNALLTPSSVIMDIGCGRGAYGDDLVPFRRQLRILKGKCQSVIGIDVAPVSQDNPFIDEFRLIEKETWPVEDQSTDLCLADNVLEHISDPDKFFSECHRILRPGGIVCIRTPNVFSYFGIVSRLVPNPQHTVVLQKAKDRVNEQDVFPTLYRCNTLGKLRKTLARHGFEPCAYGYDAEPSYLSFGRFFYFLGVLHQRFAPSFLKVGIHAFGVKVQTMPK
jgi:SAM-dependent methyltransferase